MNTNFKKKKLLVSFLFSGSIILLFIMITSIITLLKPNVGIAFGIETQGEGFNITTYPSSSFMTASNLAPGDQITADLIVKNDGQIDFTYNISAYMDGGSELLYNILDLEVSDSNGRVFYNGKLKELNTVVLGVLAKGASNILKFKVSLPIDSGNEYQGLSMAASFRLNAEEHPPNISGGQIVWDPPLEKPDVHVRRGSVMPIKFHLINSEGTFDTQKRGINLIITGVNDVGSPVEYKFSVTDGTLGWEEHGLNKPHYSLHFEADTYPVKLGTYYTATAIYGEQILGSTQFKSGH